MSRFYVGQRVRIVRCIRIENASFVGREAVVTEVRRFAHWEGDGYGLDICPITQSGIFHNCWSEEQLEPATDCYDKTTWDTCVWQPEHLRVPA